MTENEIIETLEIEKAYMDSHAGRSQSEALKYAIEAVQEIQQYRAIGTVERLKHLEEYVDTINKLCADYSAIGTVDEFKAYKQGNCTNNCKHYDSTAEYVRNKAIDEFVKQMSQEFLRNDEDGNLYIFAWIDDFKKIAEQMKAGGIDE